MEEKEFSTPKIDGVFDETFAMPTQDCDIAKTQAKPVRERSLNWLVSDLSEHTTSVYEAIKVAAIRARQIGRRQKQEIDNFNSTMQAIEIVNPDEEVTDEPGIDHFHHIKPIVQALQELSEGKVSFHYPEKETKESE